MRWSLTKKERPELLTKRACDRALIGMDYWGADLSRVPDWFTFDQLNDGTMYTFKVKEYVEGYIKKLHIYANTGLGMFITGPVGTGKKSLGSIILRSAIARGARCLSTSCFDMVERMKDKNDLLPGGIPFSDAIRGVGFLLIDDFERESSDFKRAQVKSVLKMRAEKRLPTIITSLDEIHLFRATPWMDELLSKHYLLMELSGINWRRGPTKCS